MFLNLMCDLAQQVLPEQLLQVDFYPDLLALLEHLAADGRALFAGKRFYFGCGGGTASQLQSDGHH